MMLPQIGTTFLLGINYWPRSSAMAMWERFDRAEIDEDFARIAGLGLAVVRFFLMWDSFQPAAGTLDSRALARFDDVLGLAAAHGLTTMPTLFTGHMSGVNWLPPWTLDAATATERFRTIAAGSESPHAIGDFYGGKLLETQLRFVRAVGERAADHPAVLAWDLGNEFSNLREPASAREAAAWSSALSDVLAATSHRPVTGGIHGEDLTLDRNIRPSSICSPWAFATMHGYPAYSAFARDAGDPEVVPFLAALTRAFAGKPVLCSEFGNPACVDGVETGFPCLYEDAMAEYATAVLTRLQARGTLGAFWWCWADYDLALARTPPFDRAPHELHFGIVRSDGSEKPVAGALRAFAATPRPVVPYDEPAAFDEISYYAGIPASTVPLYTEYLRAHTAEVS